jgi:hypothetical protein
MTRLFIARAVPAALKPRKALRSHLHRIEATIAICRELEQIA